MLFYRNLLSNYNETLKQKEKESKEMPSGDVKAKLSSIVQEIRTALIRADAILTEEQVIPFQKISEIDDMLSIYDIIRQQSEIIH